MRQEWYDSESKPVGIQTEEGSVLDLKNITQFPGEWSGVVYTCAIWVEELAGLRSTRSLTLLGPGNITETKIMLILFARILLTIKFSPAESSN